MPQEIPGRFAGKKRNFLPSKKKAIILLLAYVFLGTGCTYNITTIAPSVIQGKFGLSLIETSTLVSYVPMFSAMFKPIIMPFVIYKGNRGVMMFVATCLVFAGFWTLYHASAKSYYGLYIPFMLFPVACSINDFVPMNSVGLVTHRDELGFYLSLSTGMIFMANFFYPA